MASTSFMVVSMPTSPDQRFFQLVPQVVGNVTRLEDGADAVEEGGRVF
ncbi:MAG: hypothetical protein R3A10_18050 [Caldilineaceae bacterium]